MFTKGEYTSGNVTYGVMLKHTKIASEALLIKSGEVVSAYKVDTTGSYSYKSKDAKEMVQLVINGTKGCTSKNGSPAPFTLGVMQQHQFTRTRVNYTMQMFKGEVVGAYIQAENKNIELEYCSELQFPANIPYIKLTEVKKGMNIADDELDSVPVRSVEEIALEKEDVTWLRNKKYYIVNDDETAEKLFTYLENYKGMIAYDTETTGLKINCFGKIGSHYEATLAKYNEEHPNDRIRADRLVGIIFCIEPNVSYYFPCFNRKFKNLYEDVNSPVRQAVINNIRARYTIGDRMDPESDMYKYIMATADKDLRLDVILMERVRNILEKCNLVAHNGTFETKVGYMFEIDTHITDDTLIIHQLLYKFRGTTRNSGSPSNLKYLSKHELGIDQWELKDFFPSFKEDKKGTVREKIGDKKVARIDFSYMDYEGTRVYAPTDGDCTLQLAFKYKKDLIENHKELDYLYSVELIVSSAIAYMEFYGHKLDESKILDAKIQTIANMRIIESEIRQAINYSSNKEVELYNAIKELRGQIKAETDHNKITNELTPKLMALCDDIKADMEGNADHQLNLSAPGQVADLFFNKLGYPLPDDGKLSVAKKVIKGLVKERNADGSLKCPVAKMYSDYKNQETLLQKFFDNLIYFAYPQGYVFSSYGQIATATGRMSCSKPNAQQYPKVITKIVIPREGYIMADADYSQIEYRVLTALAKNDGLAKLFSDPDSDYHTLMASLMYNVDYAAVTPSMRSAAKSFNFGIPYGMGDRSLSILLTGKTDAKSIDETREKKKQYFANQPKTEKFFADIKEMAQIHGYTKTLFNRYRYYTFTDKDGNVNNAKKAAALRQAGNAVIQGCLDGNTRIQTKEFGIIRIKDAVDMHLQVWDGEKWSNGDILYSGKKRKCIVTFNNGQKFICSPTHKFLVKSAKGNERFVECQDLATKANAKNPHRIVINKEYCASDNVYSSEWAYKYDSVANNSNNAYLDNIYSSFDAGMVLGRLASDGTIGLRKEGASYVLNYVAEHEKNIIPELRRCLEFLGDVKEHKCERDGRNEAMYRLYVYSASLTKEVTDLDIKHKIHDRIFADTEMLRGFIRGLFDGDGGISGKTISLTFGTQSNFEEMCRDVQKALMFFGIRSRYYVYPDRSKITIKTNDNARFMELIGFVNEHKNTAGNALECVRDEHLFGRVLIPESVEITDEYIDMYDVCNTDGGYYVADGIITHNTAADIFKISVARNFSWIRRNKLLGKVLISNMVHDEQLMEIDVQHLNAQRVLAEVGKNMQFDLPGFPPLYIGAGIGKAWGYAKGKMAEIHPVLLQQLTEEANNIPLWREDQTTPVDPLEVIAYFDKRVVDFRRQKVADYLSNKENWGKLLAPAIGGLINLQFNYGRGDDAKAYVGPNGETYSDSEFLLLNLSDFIKENELDTKYGVKAEYFAAGDNTQEQEEEEDAYEDDETDENGELNIDDLDNGMLDDDPESQYRKIDESDKTFGSSLHDLINIFGACLLDKQHICGINVKDMHWKKKDMLIDHLAKYVVGVTEDGDDTSEASGYEIVFLTDGNILKHTGIWIDGIDNDALEKCYNTIKKGKKSFKESDYTQGDVQTRSQAK